MGCDASKPEHHDQEAHRTAMKVPGRKDVPVTEKHGAPVRRRSGSYSGSDHDEPRNHLVHHHNGLVDQNQPIAGQEGAVLVGGAQPVIIDNKARKHRRRRSGSLSSLSSNSSRGSHSKAKKAAAVGLGAAGVGAAVAHHKHKGKHSSNSSLSSTDHDHHTHKGMAVERQRSGSLSSGSGSHSKAKKAGIGAAIATGLAAIGIGAGAAAHKHRKNRDNSLSSGEGIDHEHHKHHDHHTHDGMAVERKRSGSLSSGSSPSHSKAKKAGLGAAALGAIGLGAAAHHKRRSSSPSGELLEERKEGRTAPGVLARNESTKHKERDNKGKPFTRKITDAVGLTKKYSDEYDPRFAELLVKHDIDSEPHLGSDYVLYLDMENNKKNAINFLKDLDEIKLHKLKKLSIIGMDRLGSKEIGEIRDIMHRSQIREIGVLYLHGNSAMTMKGFNDFLPSLLKATRKQIFIDSFNLSEQDLQTIFTNSNNTKYLNIVNCEVGDFGHHFTIPKDQRYKMRRLDLFWTAIYGNNKYMDEHKLAHLLTAMEDTRLGKGLKQIHVCTDDFPNESIKKIHQSHYMRKAVFDVDNKEPEVYY